jgi:hypothetical protein
LAGSEVAYCSEHRLPNSYFKKTTQNMNFKKIIPLLSMAALLSIVRCSDENAVNQTKPGVNSEIDALSKRSQTMTTGRIATDGCGAYFSGSFAGSGYYTYADKIITLCATAGGTITISCNALDVPDRFSVYDQNNNLVATSGWIGYTSNSGPWGSSLNGPSSTTLSFAKSTSSTYKLRVETVVQGVSDAWDASVGCTNVCVPVCPNSCGTSQSGSYSGTSYYVYPDRALTFCPAQNGKTIYVNCDAVGVPNRVNVYDSNGSLVATSGWIGYSSTPGPWGSTLNGPGTKTITFVKSSAITNYAIRVETVTSPSSTSDSWNTSVSCQQ